MQSNIAYPLRLTTSVDEARMLIEKIPHGTCQSAAEKHWNVTDDAMAPEESINWLFCWAKTGMVSRAAADEAKRVFDAILPIAYSQYDALIDHEYARTHRYIVDDRGTTGR